MAQKTANEYVAEARGQAERMINDARAKAEQMQRETEDKRRQTLGSLETQRHDLERRIDELRAFEREYRSRLKTYLEGQLRELGTRGSGDARAAGQPGAHASPQQPQSAPQIQMQNAQPGEGQPQQAPQQPQSPAQPAGQAPRSSPFAAANPLGGADERPGHGYSDENSDRH
jgi:vacuolar-type H+-ATPase subunit H